MLITSLNFKGLICRILLFAGLTASASPLQAQTAVPPSLPLLFDTRERIDVPDLTQLRRLRFVTTVDFPPFNFIDQSGKLSGFQVDLIREICRVLKVEDRCQVQALPFDEIETALDSQEAEVAAAGIRPTAALRERFEFSRPVLQLSARFLRNSGTASGPVAVEALAGKTAGVVAGTAHEAMLKAFFPKITVKPYDSREALLADMKSGTLALAFGDGLQLGFWAASPQANNCCALMEGDFLSVPFLGEGLTLMARQMQPDLAKAINYALLDLSRSGRLQQIALRYFPNGL